jgi:ribosome-associated heat shock protein Hsp15
MPESSETLKVRLDKWLWAARFFKTRSLAAEAVTHGRVHLNQQRVKPAKELHVGDTLSVRLNDGERTVIVRALSKQRRPASEAVLLYAETPESVQKREQTVQQHSAEHVGLRSRGTGRPTKKERRILDRFKRGD